MVLVTDELADFVSGVEFGDLPHAVTMAAERAVIDTVAAAIGGVVTDNAHLTRLAAMASFGRGGIEPWFAGPGMHTLGALMSNCAAASALDIDDGHRRAAGHPGAAVVPAVLMEAAEYQHDGRRVLAAVALGYDVALRVAAARRFSDATSFASGRWTGYGVAAALGWLRGLSRARLAHAIAIAGAEAPQNTPQGDCMASSVKGSSPWSSVTAWVAVGRAACGATGPIDLLDRPRVYDVSSITADLDARWLITETYIKPYAACRYAHSMIDAILALTAEGDRRNRRIDRLKVEIFPEAERLPNDLAPTSLEAAQFSLPFTAALAATRGGSAFLPMRQEHLADNDVLSLASAVEIDYSREFAGAFPHSLPARVTIVDGHTSRSELVPTPLGDPDNPMTREAIEGKLFALGDCVLSASALASIIKGVDRLKDGNSSSLLALLADTMQTDQTTKAGQTSSTTGIGAKSAAGSL